MKVQTRFSAFYNFIVITCFSLLLSSCSSFSQFANHNKRDNQLGNEILSSLQDKTGSNESTLTTTISDVLDAYPNRALSNEQVETTIHMFNTGLLTLVGNERYDGLSILTNEDLSSKKEKVLTLFTLFPENVNAISASLSNNHVLEEEELLALIIESGLDPSISMQATAAGDAVDVKRIGWGGSGAFSSVVEYNNGIYASSDVTGVWKQNGGGWDPLVKGLTNYNITGLLVHNNALLAVTKKQVLKLGENNVWSPIGLKLSTYRNTTLQLYSTSLNGTTCFAALEPKLNCIDELGNITKSPLSISKLKGVFFSKDNDYLYGFNANKLYRINRFDGSHSLEYTFPKNILRIAKLSNDAEPMIFTQKGVYELGSFASVNINLNNRNIVNILIDKNPTNDHFVALGGQWNAKIYELQYNSNNLTIGSKVNVVFDKSLPYRQWRKSITKPIGMPHSVKGKIWFSDYRGLYAYDVLTNQFYEKSRDASNFVGTDLHISNNKLYIASMDNGLVSMSLKKPNKFTSIFPRKSADWLLAGHTWSVNSNDKGVFATLSPWNLSQDYILTADTNNTFQYVQNIDNLNSRKDPITFWGQSYTRKLVLLSDGIFVYKDGTNGGLYKLAYSSYDNDYDIQETTSDKLFSTEKNRVYRALTQYSNYLVSYHIDDQKRLLFNDINTGKLIKTVNAPNGLWAFDLVDLDNTLYLLGARGSAVIYRFNEIEETFSEILKVPTASAFLSMKKAPDNSILIAGAVSWNGRPNGKVLLQKHDTSTWLDITCVMPNESGVVDIEFTEDSQYVYLLQQVGSAVRIKVSYLQNHQGC